MRITRQNILYVLASAQVLLLSSAALQAQVLSLVEVHEDNESPEANGSPIEQTHVDGPGPDGLGLAISPDGNHVYVTSSSGDDAVTVFSRNSGTGALALVEVHEDDASPETNGSPIVQTHLDYSLGVAVSADGNHVYVTSAIDDAVTVFSRNSGTGALTLVEVHEDNESPEANGSPIAQTHLDNAFAVVISPDGNHVYVTSPADDAVTVFSRSGGTGALTLVEVHEDNGSPEANGSPITQTHLAGAAGVAISADGNHVYVVNADDDAVTVFSRNSGTGALSLVEVHEDNGSPEVNGSPTAQTHLDSVIGVAISPDGNHVYVTSQGDSAVTVFSRNSGTGTLALVEVQEDNESPEMSGSPTVQTHLELARGVAATNSHVLVASLFDDAVTVFSRDSGTGALTLVEVHEDNASPEANGSPIAQTHLEAAASVAISPGGKHAYVTSFNDDAVTAFAASPPLPVELTTFSVSDGASIR